MGADSTITLQRYRFLEAKLKEAKEKKDEAEREAKRQEFQISLFEVWIDEIKSRICLTCNGYGKLRDYIAQDEVRLCVCRSCNGEGVIKPKTEE